MTAEPQCWQVIPEMEYSALRRDCPAASPRIALNRQTSQAPSTVTTIVPLSPSVFSCSSDPLCTS